MQNTIILTLIIIINTAIGILIKAANPARSQNKQFFILSLALTAWMMCVLSIMHAESARFASLMIRAATIVSMSLPFQLGMLLESIRRPSASTLQLYRNKLTLALIGIFISILCMTDSFMTEVIMPSAENVTVTVPEAKYGPAFIAFAVYFFVTLIFNIITAFKGMLADSGLIRLELQYVLLGAGIMLISGSFISLILPWLTKTTQVQQYGPVSVIAMNLVIAYGIATRHILDVGTVIRRGLAHILLTSYLIVIYFAVWNLVNFIFRDISFNSEFIAPIIATLAVAFSMAPVHGRLQKVADKLVASQSMNIPETLKRANAIFQSVTTMDSLLSHFKELLTNALGAEYVVILLSNNQKFRDFYTKGQSRAPQQIELDNPIVETIESSKDPVSIDKLERIRLTAKRTAALDQMRSLNASLAIGVFLKAELTGIILFGPRMGGRIYDQTEQDALQILCNQFAVALENAQLYTEMQDSKIRNEIMLDQLVSGVIVANPNREISLLNNEAQRITDLEEKAAKDKNINILPGPIAEALEQTLTNKKGIRNVDATLFASDDTESSTAIRMGSAYIVGHDGKSLGALLVFTDLTELKGLEEQVRRSDQLSSVGTLAAGMAHEIKNPLVTIKTFTQLLPQRYADEDFRNDFASLVAHEVSRIDGIVNELLSFSKPAKPHLVPMDFHETIEQTLKLIHEQVTQKNIHLTDRCHAEKSEIFGDAKLLSQALVNLNLNAIEAIGEDGSITVGTINCKYRFANGEMPEHATLKECIRLQISDSGKGIPQSDLQKIFDPFFTSKSEGTGMGLSVSHGIISEHHGVIEVESEPGRGTTFFIYIPLLEEAAVA